MNSRVDKRDYTLVREELLKPEDKLMKEVVDFWIHVEQENKIRNERIKHLCGEGFLDE